MNKPKCPLAGLLPSECPQPSILETFDAQAARECAKAFEGLPYTPNELELVKHVSERITEAARLGFDQVLIERKISSQFAKTLEEKGFQVHWTAEIETWDNGSQIWLYESMGSEAPKPEADYILRVQEVISWAEEKLDSIPSIRQVQEKAEEEKKLLQEKYDKEYQEHLGRVRARKAIDKDFPSYKRKSWLEWLLG